MYRREVWVVALNLIEAPSHSRDILYAVLGGSNFREWSLAAGASAPISQPDNGWIALRRRSRSLPGNTKARSCQWRSLRVQVGARNFHTARFSKGMSKSRTEASRMARGGRQSSVRGALYESASIAAVYGTICSLVWETWGRIFWVREYPDLG